MLNYGPQIDTLVETSECVRPNYSFTCPLLFASIPPIKPFYYSVGLWVNPRLSGLLNIVYLTYFLEYG